MAAEDETAGSAGSSPAPRGPAKKAVKKAAKAAKKAPAKKVPAKKTPAKKAAPRMAPERDTTPVATTPEIDRGSTVTDDQQDDGSRNRTSKTSPESLAAEIERTRGDLSVPLAAIPAKVTPRRVAPRPGHTGTTAVPGPAGPGRGDG